MNHRLAFHRVLLAAAITCLSASAAAAQTGTAVLHGVVRGPDAAPLKAILVSIEGDTLIGGSRAIMTGSDGFYRFPALPAGVYVVRIASAGLQTVSGPVRLDAGQDVRIDASLGTAGAADSALLPEPVAGPGRGPVVSTALTTQTLETIPLESRAGFGAVALAPAVDATDFSAYAEAGAGMNAYRIEGLDAGDPEGGAPWLLPAYHWIDELTVVGPGAGAAIGGFTGVTASAVLRSGGNAFHGLGEVLVRTSALTAANVSSEMLDANAALAPAETEVVSETSAQAGGPLRRDRAWFFAGVQVRTASRTPAGYPAVRPPGIQERSGGTSAPSELSPRAIFKPTWRLSDRDTVTAFVTAERYAAQGRDAASQVAPEATLEERAGTVAWSGRLTRIVSPGTVFEAGSAGFRGSDDRTPYNGDTPGWYDVVADYYSVNAPYFSIARRTRQQADARLSRLVTAFGGTHDVQAGIEAAQSAARSDYGYPGGKSIDAAAGVPRFIYLWDGARRETSSRRVTAFAEDGWGVTARLRLDAGARLDWTTASNRHSGARVYDAVSLAPRAGLAWQTSASGRTTMRGHYGWYYDDLTLARLQGLDPKIAAVSGGPVDRQLRLTAPAVVIAPAASRRAGTGLGPPRSRQAVVGVEERFGRRLTAAIYGFDRRADRWVDDVLAYAAGSFVKATIKDAGPDGFAGSLDDTAVTVDVYTQVSDPGRNTPEITNPAGAFRTSRGILATAALPAGRRLALQGSWVFSKTTGNVDGDGAGPTLEYDSPNTDPALQPLRTGRVAADRTHMVRLFGSYRLPLGVRAAAVFAWDSGRTFTRTLRVRVNERRVDVFAEPRGSQRYDPERRLDVRLERQLPGLRPLSISAEAFNVLNDATVTARVTRSGLQYFMPAAVSPARRIRIGVAYRF